MVFRYAGRNISTHNSHTSRKFYNLIGWLYDSVYSDQIYNYRKAMAHVADHYVHSGDRVFDVGCGTGIFIDQIAPKVGMILGLDLSRGMLKKARRKHRHHPHVEFVGADCRYLPIRGQFDVVFSAFMLVILPRKERFAVITSLYPLVRDGGRIVFLTAHDSLSTEWLTRNEWTYYLEQAGFEQVVFEELFDFYRVVHARKRVM
jgi:ubiquinone/menaquinone biosynthesis C-methylase UbiE